MKLDIEKKKEYIQCGDFVYSTTAKEYGFVCLIDDKYYFVNKDDFERWSDPYEKLSELIHKVNLTLIAKNKDLKISLND